MVVKIGHKNENFLCQLHGILRHLLSNEIVYVVLQILHDKVISTK